MADRVTPSRRFLPGDPRVSEPYRLTPQLALRVAVLGFFALALFAVLFLRLWALQVLSGDRYLAQANDNRVRTLRLEAPRGPILDRSGHVLVTNTPGTRVELWPSDLPKTWAAQLAELRKLSSVTGVPTKEIVSELAKHGNDPLTPIVVQRGIKQQQIYYLLEHQNEFPGVRLPASYLRKYPYQSLAAQVLGYVGQISPEEYKALKKKGYLASDSVGQSGIEHSYDTYLRGKDGTAQLTVDSRGRPKTAAVPIQASTPGETLRLTLDINLQKAAEKALRDAIKLARTTPEGRYANGGAVVALDPRNGAVLAMASNPTYKPSLFAGRKNAAKLAPLLNPTVAKEDNYPILNRATQVPYPPGSTFKPVTALAAMQEHLLTPFTSLHCTPTYTAYGQAFNNWTPDIDQWMDLRTALAESCDTFFYQLGDDFFRLPPNRAPAAGLGESPRVREVHRARHRRRIEGPDPDAGMALRTLRRSAVQGIRGQDLETGLLDPARHRPGRPPRDPTADDAVLCADRERRQARHSAPRRGRRANRQQRPAASGSPPLRR